MNVAPPVRSNLRQYWLSVAYAFPPINRSGTFRTLGFVKHLHWLGWDATVLTVPPGSEPVDDALLPQVPPSAEVIRVPWTDLIARAKRMWPGGSSQSHRPTGSAGAFGSDTVAPDTPAEPMSGPAWREWISRVLTTPDSRVGWITPALREGLNAIRRRRPEVIYSTSPYMSAHLIALRLSRRAKIPWVADFRDPWGGNPFRDLGFKCIRRWDHWLERLVLKNATQVVVNTPTMLEHLRQRFPFLDDKSSVILNGFDGDLLAEIEPIRIGSHDDFVLTHCGQFYGPRSPVVWFEACRRAFAQSPSLANRLHVTLLGPSSYDGRPLAELAKEAGIGDQVHVLGPKSHRETLAYMAGSDALMLAGSSGPGGELQVPNKLYEYLAMRRPIIAAVPASSPVVDILDQAHAEALVCAPDDSAALADAIVHLAAQRHVDVVAPWSGVARFDRTHRAKELAEVFRNASRPEWSGRGRVVASAEALALEVTVQLSAIQSNLGAPRA